MKKTIQLSVISNQLKKEYWIHPFLSEAIAHLTLQLGRPDSPYNLISTPQIGHEVSQVARNYAAWNCIDGHWIGDKLIKPDFLVMIDSDMAPILPSCWAADEQEHMHNLLDLVKMADENSYPVFGAVYPGYKNQEWFLHVYHKNKFSDNLYESYSIQELMEWRAQGSSVRSVDAIGTGAIVMRRDVVEAVVQHNEKRGVVDQITGNGIVFERGRDNVGRTFHGEDLLFCSRVKELGFDVWTSIDFLYDHYHTMSMLEIPAWDRQKAGPTKPTWKVEDYGLPKDWKLPEITAWSMTPGGCRILRELCSELPEGCNILEYGPGISSLVILDEIDHLQDVVISRIEHSIEYCAYLQSQCDPGIVCVRTLLKDGFYDYPLKRMFRLIVVDGPPSHEGTREPAMYKVFSHWAVGGYLVLDDAQREPETTIVRKWAEDFKGKISYELRDDGYGRKLAIFKKESE